MKRLLAMVLALCMLLGCAAQAENTTPTDIATEAPAVPQTEAPAAEPTSAPTEAPTEAPAEAPTEALTEEPAEEPAAEITEAPSEEPAEAPTEVPTEEPTQEPTEAPTPEAPVWDESRCDHANENCEQAPACDTPDCLHIGLDANGIEYPLCGLGRWLLDQQDSLARAGGMRAMARSVRSNTIDLNKADAAIYRSGNYRVTGGEARTGAKLAIAADRLVVLDLRDVSAGEIRLNGACQVTLQLQGISTVEKLTLDKASVLHITEGGALTVEKLTGNGDNEGKIAITGGSVRAEVNEAEGRRLYAFDAKGAASVTVDEKPLLANVPHADGKMYLWLKAPAQGKKWAAAMNGTTLAVTQADDLPEAVPGTIRQGETNVLEADQTYTLTGAVAEGTRLVIDAEGVTLLLEDVTFPGTLVEASCAYTLRSRGATTLGAAGTLSLAGSGRAAVFAQGRLELPGGVEAAAQYVGGAIVLPEAPAGWVAWTLTQPLTNQAVTLDGAETPLLLDGAGALLLPAPGKNMTYTVTADEAQVAVTTVPAGELFFDLTQNTRADAGSAEKFTVTGGGDYVAGQITASGAAAQAAFRHVKLQGDGALLALANETLNVTLTGDNGLIAAADSAVRLTEGAALTLNAVSGRLLLRGQKSLDGMTLSGNIKVEPEPSTPHTVLMIRDGGGNPVPNTAVTLMLNGQTYDYITHYDGSIHLWGMGSLSGTDAAVSDGKTVYTAVVMNGQGQADTGLDISHVTVKENADGSVEITFKAEGAKSVGVQAYAAASARDIPDDYVQDALRFTGRDGRVVVTGVEAGKALSFRVYASAAEGAELTADTADGFQFSEVYVHQVRRAWSADKSADAAYTGKAYCNPLKLPEGASVAYTGRNLNSKGQPVCVGSYTMEVTIPENDPVYLPGRVSVDFKITRIPLTISPDPNQEKYQGEEEPVLTFTVKGLMKGDELLGELLRRPGEDVGNYAFILDGFEAPDYYALRLASGAPQFTILPMLPPSGPRIPGGTYEVLRPVRQEIVRADKRRVAVTLNTQESLTVNYSVIGQIIRSTEDNLPRPFSPSLTWREDTDQVLLRLLTEAELNKDGGYVTDVSGEPVWGGRYLRLSWLGIRHLNQMGVDAISLNNNGVAVTVPLAWFMTEEMEDLVRENGGTLKTVSYRITVEPVAEEAMAAGAVRPVSDAWRVAVDMLIDRQELDITAAVPDITVAVDLEPVAELLAAVEMYDEEAFPVSFTLNQLTAEGALPMEETAFVQPYLPEEAELAAYACVMYTHRYLSAPLTQPGIVYAVRVQP